MKPSSNPAFVRTKKDEKTWDRAKSIVHKDYEVPDDESKWDSSTWALTNRIFHRIKHRVGGGKRTGRRNPAGGLARSRSPKDFDPVALATGTLHELEHTSDPYVAQRIAMDHIVEHPDYYDRLETCFPKRRKNAPAKHYQTFHGVEPDIVLEGRVWVPGKLALIGHGIDVGYGIRDERSTKDGWYVHDFGKEVKIYRRARKGEKVDWTYRRFPRSLMVLGYNLGFTYEDVNGKKREVKGSQKKFLTVTANKRTLVIVGTAGVEYLMQGGKMRVTDWIHD